MERARGAGDEENGPKHVVWAQGMPFFVRVLFILTNVVMRWKGPRKSVTKKTGPNVASGVVWALGKFFYNLFIFLKLFYVLT